MIEKIIESITPSESKIKELEASYNAVCSYLEKNSAHPIYSYVQGSQAIGTLIKPISDDGDYDIDIVMEIDNIFDSAKDQKMYIGNILMSSERYINLLVVEGKRCWTLEYSDQLNYHLDILPAVPFDNKIKITNKISNTYEYRTSNPNKYATWFLGKAKGLSLTTRDYLEMPKNNAETDLQKLVMFAKYHRDIYCANNNISNLKPISVIITTAFGLSYNPRHNLQDNIIYFITFCRENILSQTVPFKFCSPVDEEENFCDKWNENPQKAKVFEEWLNNLELLFKTGLNRKSVQENFGTNVASSILLMEEKNYASKTKPHRAYGTF